MHTTRRLPRETWASFLDDLADERRGAPVLLVVDWSSAGEEVEAHDVLLQGLVYDRRSDVVEISAQRPSPAGPTVLRHHVSAPQAVDVDSPAGILPREVRVTGADGVVTSVRLDPAPELSS
jgi:hypothetical protein